MTRDEYIQLCHSLWEHNKAYYIDCAPKISDYEYDQMMQELLDFEAKHPEWIESFSPSQRVGESLTEGFQNATHEIPMLSLANTYSDEEIEEFIQRLKKNLPGSTLEYSLELKMDGTAISLIYEKGIFKQAITRGNGFIGDDVTQNIKTITSLPLKLTTPSPPDLIEVRGEVYLTLKTFYALNEEREENGLTVWANPRNAAAGSLKLLNPKETSRRHLQIVLYGVARDSSGSLSTQFETHNYLKNLGFPILEHTFLAKTNSQIWSFRDKVASLREKLSYEIDGVVIKLNNLQLQKELGSTSKIPRWAVAYKFAPQQAKTKLEKIVTQVGRTGVITPVAQLQPVRLAGSTISRVTLHNEDEVQRKDIRVSDTVIIEKGGDVIPKIVQVVLKDRLEDAAKWCMPKKCPSCQGALKRLPGEVAYRCLNVHCPEKKYRSLVFFISKQGMDIDHLGVKVLKQLIDRGFVKRPSDLYQLTEKELYQLDGFKQKSVDKLLRSIEKSKTVSLARFILALDIRYVGATTAEALAAQVDTIEELTHLSREELYEIEGIGQKVAQSIADFFSQSRNTQEIKQLLALGVCPTKPKITKDHPFYGKNFVLTGTLSKYTRDEAAKLIKERGGKVQNSVGSKTDFVLAGDSPGSKYEKALKLGIVILDEALFEARI